MPGPRPSTRPCRSIERLALAAALAALASAVQAEDLIQVYRDAQRYDAAYAAAQHALVAGRERLPQGRALLLPTLNLSANATRSEVDVDSREPTLSPSFERSPETAGYADVPAAGRLSNVSIRPSAAGGSWAK